MTRQYIYKLEPREGVKQLYVINLNGNELVSLWMVIIHNDIESKIILNVKDIVEDCKTAEPANSHIMSIVRSMFSEMSNQGSLINMEFEENDTIEDIIEAADEASKSATTEYDDIVKQLRGE
jgi:hypothetical protein